MNRFASKTNPALGVEVGVVDPVGVDDKVTVGVLVRVEVKVEVGTGVAVAVEEGVGV